MHVNNVAPVYHPQHPARMIDTLLAARLSAVCDKAEALGRLHEEQLQVIYAQQWFKMFVPKIFGGLELSLPQGLQLQEALAYIDGSIGWTVTLCSGANWFAGFLPVHISRDIFTGAYACLAGSGKATGEAVVAGDEYIVTGSWDYATGAAHATFFTANCVVKDGAETQVRSFWFRRDEVTINESWHMMGMVATGSQRFGVAQLHVGKERAFTIDAAHAVMPQAVYRYPFLQFAEATLAANMCGMGLHFLHLCEALVKGNEPALTMLDASNAQAAALRSHFYNTAEASWQMLLKDGTINDSLLAEVSQSAKALANGIRKLTEALYPFCGMAAAEKHTTINRVWRDMHTASQHVLLRG
ncbi:acyl-CoA dehydrogenase [Panacibacter sp. DH6]|uniref:Acyl-CoA dehydrogenase n=1 Tax=Panacibacter microcysteis TaxID=2793269 RepID=A0A931GZ92_9BACT|nr:acyl-CoA dehydrogenase [Panacibacter microcysteis]MBG9378094.1 acyl-CoA dehydrogenase [Panacibacter microcysteis]